MSRDLLYYVAMGLPRLRGDESSWDGPLALATVTALARIAVAEQWSDTLFGVVLSELRNGVPYDSIALAKPPTSW